MPDFTIESDYPFTTLLAGVDEAGRGPWAGPVVASAVIFPARKKISDKINDSKKLKPITREMLYGQIMEHGIVGIGSASVEEIDTLNIWGATALAMRRAVEAMSKQPDLALIDGKLIPKNFPCAAKAVVKGDSVSYSIAAASIIAKVTRDRIMHDLACEYPQYGFERHAGYGTKFHLDAIRTHGPCPAHRTTWPLYKLLPEAA
jgi:ribonuclease HII